MWHTPAPEVGAAFARVERAAPGRFVLGLGPSHGPIVETLGRRYTRPLAQVAAYVDALDALPRDTRVPAERRVLAALGPKALALAAQRFAGAHRAGFTEDDLVDAGSDRLVDALYAWGDVNAAARRVAEHRAAGADHVAVQVITGDVDLRTRSGRLPRAEWRRLAPALVPAAAPPSAG